MVHDFEHAVNRDQNLQASILQLCRSRQLRILQKPMVTTLVNGYLAYQQLCSGIDCHIEGGGVVVGGDDDTRRTAGGCRSACCWS
jgi:hypothetical protein